MWHMGPDTRHMGPDTLHMGPDTRNMGQDTRQIGPDTRHHTAHALEILYMSPATQQPQV